MARHRLAGVSFLVACAVLVALAVPRLQAALAGAEAFALFEPTSGISLENTEDARLGEMDRSLDRAARADGLDYRISHARAGIALSRATMAMGETRASLLHHAQEQAEAAAVAAPARADVWGRVLLAEYLANGLTPRAVEALRMSYASGPQHPQPGRIRLAIGIESWSRLPPDLQDRTRRQARDMWRNRHLDALAETALNAGPFGNALITSQAPDDAARDRLARLIQRKARDLDAIGGG